MPASTPPPDVRFLLLPLPEFTLLPFGGFLDKLRFSADEEDYSRQRYCSWQILGLEAGQVESSSGVAVAAGIGADDVNWSDYDYLVVFGGRRASAMAALAGRYGPLLRRAAGRGLKLVCIDNASFLFAACGLLAGRRVAVHWRHEAEFRAAYPRLRVASGQLYCLDGNRISCPGGSAAIELAVELLSRACGRTRALKGLADMLVDEPRSEAHELKSRAVEAPRGRHVDRAVALMRHLLAGSATAEEIARRVGISRRQLDRLFRDGLGMTAREYWREMRLKHVAWRLANSSHGFGVIADEVGVPDAGYLAKMFRRRFGVSMGAYRQRFTTGRDAPGGLEA